MEPSTEEGDVHPDLEVLLEEKVVLLKDSKQTKGDAGLQEDDKFGFEHPETKASRGATVLLVIYPGETKHTSTQKPVQECSSSIIHNSPKWK